MTAQILVVDDKPKNLVAMRGLLNSPDWDVVCAESGVEALQRLLNSDFAVLLLDVQMPGMDGFELARLVRERPRFRQTPIIFVTAIHQSEMYAREGYNLGAVDYLFKPLVPEVVRSKVAFFVDYFVLHHERLARQKAENERRLAELAQQNERLRFEYRMRNLFLGNLSHELRTPLNAIVGFADLLAAEPLLAGSDFETPRHYAEHISRAADRLLQVVRNMLDYSQLENMAAQRETFELGTIFDEIQGAAGELAAARDIVIIADIEPAVRRVCLDAAKLRQITFNFVDNAVKFAPTGSTIRLNARSDGARGLVIEVTDEGEPIAPRDQGRLFIEFGKLEGYRASEEGAGLGLALSRHLAELLGGNIGVRAHSQRGNTFYASFPEADSSAAEAV